MERQILGSELTVEQQAAVKGIQALLERPDGHPITVGGLAGTGKTFLANQLPDQLGVSRSRVAYCAYTGKAASRLDRGSTIHSLIYTPQEVHSQGCPRFRDRRDGVLCDHLLECGVKFMRVDRLRSGGQNLELVIVDEASMVSREIFEDLTSYGVPVVWIGDHGQLPPVKSSFNLMSSPRIRLETIHRQVADSPILKLAMMARSAGRVPFGVHGPGVSKRRRNEHWPTDVGLLLCGRNNTRVALNEHAREQLGFPPDRPVAGDRLVCLRNDRKVGVFNGQIATVTEDARSDPEDSDSWLVKVLLDGAKEPITVSAWKDQFGEGTTLRDVPRYAGLWDFGYCLTVHKAQGSEAESVVLLEQPIGDPKRWLYTGITRAKESLEIIAR